MNRRAFITLFGGTAATWPLAARAQQPERMWRIGALMGYAESDPEAQTNITAFRQELQKLGWIGAEKSRSIRAGHHPTTRKKGNDSRKNSSRCILTSFFRIPHQLRRCCCKKLAPSPSSLRTFPIRLAVAS